MTDIADNVGRVRERISLAAERAGRKPEEITLVAITKTIPTRTIEEAWHAGLRQFGENQVQEAELKVLWSRDARMDLEWHMVGHLQRNKVKKAAQLFDMIQSVDSVRLAEEISRRCHGLGINMPLLLEVNVSGESSKYGFVASNLDASQEKGLLRSVEQILALPNLEPQGLMTVAPYQASEKILYSCFSRLRQLLETLRATFPAHNWRHLSMGMTDDFEHAIAEGATIVRIGRAIFGERRDN
ncbi:MAG: YggS family pyridoxal phosphate-dependent enzyme [Anaerolineae bacterium]|nr:YggS family pyridoxal phosphate-dependent enzyme [Anaerolineae bacterium]